MLADTPKGYTEADVRLVALATGEHHLVHHRADADGNSPCVCDRWWDGSDGPDWDDHMAEVALAALAGVGRLRTADDESARAEVESLTDQLGDMRASVSAAEAEVDDLRGRLKATSDAYNELANERHAGRLLPEDTRCRNCEHTASSHAADDGACWFALTSAPEQNLVCQCPRWVGPWVPVPEPEPSRRCPLCEVEYGEPHAQGCRWGASTTPTYSDTPQAGLPAVPEEKQ